MKTLWFAFSFGLKMFDTSQLACEAARSSDGKTTAPIYRLTYATDAISCCSAKLKMKYNIENCEVDPGGWGCPEKDAPKLTIMSCVSSPSYSVVEEKP